MLGFELARGIPGYEPAEKSPALQFINALHNAGLLAVPAGTHVIRLLPPLNLKKAEADEALEIIEQAVAAIAS